MHWAGNCNCKTPMELRVRVKRDMIVCGKLKTVFSVAYYIFSVKNSEFK